MNAAPLGSVPANPRPEGGEAVFLYRDDICLRAARWPVPDGVPPKGTMLLLHGRTEFVEKYYEVITDLRTRGYAVFTFDWRGQGLSSRELDDPLRGYISDFQHYLEDMHFILQSDFTRDLAGPVYMLSHSMGGNIGLRYLHDYPGRVEKAVFCAPMLGIGPRSAQPALRTLTTGAVMLGRAKQEPFISKPGNPAEEPFSANTVTSSEPRFERTKDTIRAEPRLGLSGLSWQWMTSAFRSMDMNWRRDFLEGMKTPSLIIGAGDERIVDPTCAERFAALSPVTDVTIIEGGMHELLMEQDVYREQFFAAMDEFLAR